MDDPSRPGPSQPGAGASSSKDAAQQRQGQGHGQGQQQELFSLGGPEMLVGAMILVMLLLDLMKGAMTRCECIPL